MIQRWVQAGALTPGESAPSHGFTQLSVPYTMAIQGDSNQQNVHAERSNNCMIIYVYMYVHIYIYQCFRTLVPQTAVGGFNIYGQITNHVWFAKDCGVDHPKKGYHWATVDWFSSFCPQRATPQRCRKVRHQDVLLVDIHFIFPVQVPSGKHTKSY